MGDEELKSLPLNKKEDCIHNKGKNSVPEQKGIQQLDEHEGSIHSHEAMNKEEIIFDKNIFISSENIEKNSEYTSFDVSSVFVNDAIDKQCKCSLKSSSSGMSSISTCHSENFQPMKQLNGNSIQYQCFQQLKENINQNDCSPTTTSKHTHQYCNCLTHKNMKQKLKCMSNNESLSSSCISREKCPKCFYLEAEISQLKFALDDSKKKNKKLKNNIELLQGELAIFKHSKNIMKQKHAYPGLLIDVIGEIYAAQRERDEAIMARIHLANDERDIALNQLEELKEEYYRNITASKKNSNIVFDSVQRKNSCMEMSDEILRNRNIILQQISKSLSRSKDSEDLEVGSANKPEDDQRYGRKALCNPWQQVVVQSEQQQHYNDTGGTEQPDTETPYRKWKKYSRIVPSPILREQNNVGRDNQTDVLQRRLLEEMEARQRAEENCQKLEKLVNVLKRKVNGLILGHPLMSSSVDGIPGSPVLTPSNSSKAIVSETPESNSDPSWEDPNTSFA